MQNKMEVKPGCYLLIGEDDWSKKNYIKQVKESVLHGENDMMNSIELSEKDVTAQKVKEALDTLPFFTDLKYIYIEDSGLFKPGRKDESEKFAEVLEDVPEYNVFLINEKEVDKRSKLYKLIKSRHSIIEFNFPTEDQIVNILNEEIKNHNIKIDRGTLIYFVRNMPTDMNYVMSEWHKLLSFTDNAVTKADIDKVCVFSLETRVFDLIKEVTNGNGAKVINMYTVMIESKESPLAILALIARQFRMLYEVKYLNAKKVSEREMASSLKLPPFVVKEMIGTSGKFSFNQLEELIAQMLETDKIVKTSGLKPEKAVELLILKILNMQKTVPKQLFSR